MGHPKAFTDKFLAALKPAPGRYDVLDGARRGLTLRVFPTGTKTFVFRYQRNGAVGRITLGNYPTMPLRLAYEAHAELTKRLNRGEDPRATPRGAAGPGAASDSADGSPPSGPTVGGARGQVLAPLRPPGAKASRRGREDH